MPQDEDIIIQKLKEGDYGVFKYVFDTYTPYLLSFTFRFIPDKEVCKDVIQEVFISLWENRKNTEVKSLRNYLYTSAKNKCLTYLRHLGVQDRNQLYIVDAYLFDQTEPDVFDEDIKSDILKAVAELPKKMQRIFRAKYIHELSVKEIAEDFGISEHTVATQLKKARLRIRSEILITKKS